MKIAFGFQAKIMNFFANFFSFKAKPKEMLSINFQSVYLWVLFHTKINVFWMGKKAFFTKMLEKP